MGAVIGDLLPLAVGVAVSPVPVIAVILMLLAPRAGGTNAGFLSATSVRSRPPTGSPRCRSGCPRSKR